MHFQKIDDTTYLVRLEYGEDVRKTLTQFSIEQNITAGFFHGLGAMTYAKLAYYSMGDKKYHDKEFEGEFEVCSINGNLSYYEGKPLIHMHAALGKTDLSLFGGHIVDATCGPTLELHLHTYDANIEREYDDTIGLPLLSLSHCTICDEH